MLRWPQLGVVSDDQAHPDPSFDNPKWEINMLFLLMQYIWLLSTGVLRVGIANDHHLQYRSHYAVHWYRLHVSFPTIEAGVHLEDRDYEYPNCVRSGIRACQYSNQAYTILHDRECHVHSVFTTYSSDSHSELSRHFYYIGDFIEVRSRDINGGLERGMRPICNH